VTHHDRHALRLITDLISHRDKIFEDLKRQSIRKARPESLDESHRRQRYEARSRAVSAAARSPRFAPADHINGDKTPTGHTRLSGISGILGNRPPSLQLDPGDNVSLDGGLPAGGVDEGTVDDKSTPAPVEVTVTDESVVGETPTKKPSLGRSHPIRGARAGLQRHIKRESIMQAEPASPDIDKDAVAVATNVRRSLDGKPVGVTLSDGPVRE
jgi:hypothetical protein